VPVRAAGCLEAYLADYALAREAATALGRNPRTAQSPQGILETLFEEAKAATRPPHHLRPRRALPRPRVANVAQLFDPELVILSGERMRYDFLYADEVLAEMRALTLPQGRPAVRVEVHAWGDLVWAKAPWRLRSRPSPTRRWAPPEARMAPSGDPAPPAIRPIVGPAVARQRRSAGSSPEPIVPPPGHHMIGPMRMTTTFDEMWGRGMAQAQGFGQGSGFGEPAAENGPAQEGAGPAPDRRVLGLGQHQAMYQGLREPYRSFAEWLREESPGRLRRKQHEADDVFRLMGITFNVYGRDEAAERLIPFDIIPRIIAAREWSRLSRGIEQRVRAITPSWPTSTTGRRSSARAASPPT
jgi:hypothetical protein